MPTKCLQEILASVNEDDTSDEELADDNASDDGLGDADECDSSSLDSYSDTYWFIARFKFHAKVGLWKLLCESSQAFPDIVKLSS